MDIQYREQMIEQELEEIGLNLDQPTAFQLVKSKNPNPDLRLSHTTSTSTTPLWNPEVLLFVDMFETIALPVHPTTTAAGKGGYFSSCCLLFRVHISCSYFMFLVDCGLFLVDCGLWIVSCGLWSGHYEAMVCCFSII